MLTYIHIVLYVYTHTHTHMLPRWHSGKELTCQCRRWLRNSDLIPGLERIPVGRHSNSLQYSYLENPMDRRDWQAIVHRVTKSWTRLSEWIRTRKNKGMRTQLYLKRTWMHLQTDVLRFATSASCKFISELSLHCPHVSVCSPEL